MADRRFDLILERHRGTLIATAIIGCCGAVANLFVAQSVPQVSTIDLILVIATAVTIAVVLVWVLMDTRNLIRPAAMVVAGFIVLSVTLRLFYSLFGPASAQPPDAAIAPVAVWAPFTFLMAFLLLEQRLALRASVAFIVLTSPPVAVYGLLHLDQLSYSPRLSQLLVQFLFAHPIYALLLHIISAAHRQHDALRATTDDDTGENLPLDELDLVTLLPNRNAFRKELSKALSAARDRGTDLTVGLLQLDGLDAIADNVDGEFADDLARTVAKKLRSKIDDKSSIGRLSHTRFALVWPGKDLRGVIQTAEQLIAALNRQLSVSADPSPSCRMGLASYHPGESQQALLFRCDKDLRRAKMPRFSGVGYDTIDVRN